MGYIGYSRSERSQYDIDNYVIPLSMITRNMINNYIEFSAGYDDYSFLNDLSIDAIKFVAKTFIGAESWHHTSKYYNKTDHYSVDDIVSFIKATGIDTVKNQYKLHLSTLPKNNDKVFKLGVIVVKEYGGSFKKPKFLGFKQKIGVIIDDRFYYSIGGAIRYHQTTANSVWNLKRYDSIEQLQEENEVYSAPHHKDILEMILERKIK